MQLFNGNEKIELAKEKNKIQVRLSKTQYVSDALPVIRKYVDAQETDDTLLVTLELPEKAISFSEQTLISKTRVEKLQLADKVRQLTAFIGKYQIPFIHPNNLYLDGERLFVVYSGLQDILAPKENDATLFLKNMKALILSIFNQKSSYEKLLEGGSALNDKFSQSIVNAKNPEELFSIVRNELVETQEKVRATKQLVSKKRYQMYRFAGVFAIVIALVSVIFLYRSTKSAEKQSAIIEAQTSFMTNNYAKTQGDLEKYEPQDLTKSAKYILAVSSVNLSDLTATQKQTILNNISIKTDNNTLNYWVYIGRGNFDKALNLAQNLGDEQLTLLSYTDLYQATKLNDKMDGAKKQKLLADYKKQIEELTAKLGQ